VIELVLSQVDIVWMIFDDACIPIDKSLNFLIKITGAYTGFIKGGFHQLAVYIR